MVISQGRSAYSVLVPARPSPVETFASEELVRYLAAVTGVALGVTHDDAWDGEQPCLSVGDTGLFRRYLTPLDDALHDRLLLKRVGAHVLLNGNNRRGVLFAVYRFLETCADVSFALAGDEHVPRGGVVRLPVNEVMEEAHLANREIIGHPSDVPETVGRLDYLAKNLGNSIMLSLETWRAHRDVLLPEIAKRGLDLTIGGHIYSEFLPEEEHFDAHPEWFPEIDGVRVRGTGQVCYSEAGVDVLIERVVRGFEGCWSDVIRRFSLWYGDNALFCTCAQCRRRSFYDHYLALLSRLKSALQATAMPVDVDFAIYNSDNAYKSDLTLLAPDFTESPGNVSIFYSYWGRDYSQRLAESASPYDAQSYDRLREWCGLFRTAPGIRRAGEYYADSNQLTAMAPAIPDLIKDDLLVYRNAGIDGLHVCVHLWWSPHPSYPMFWVMSFNLHSFFRFAWNHNLAVAEVLPPLLRRYFGEAADDAEALLAAIREAVLPLTRYNLAGPVCSCAGTIVWHVPPVEGGPRYSFDPDQDEFAAFRGEVLRDLERAWRVMDQSAPRFEVYRTKAPAGTVAAQNLERYYTFCRGNLRSKLLQFQAQQAIAGGDTSQARALLLEVLRLEESLYGRGIDDLRQWLGLYGDRPPVQALDLEPHLP